MAREREVKVTVLGDSRGGQQALDDLDTHAARAESRVGSFAKNAAIGLAGVGVAAGGMAVKFLMAGSDMNETLSKSNTIFGEQGKAIENWASTAASNFGQSKQQALEAAGTFGNLFTQLDIGADKAAGMSKQMVELASDFASFHNADPAEVLEAMTAAFRGEYDAVQRFVPTINAAAVEQKALEMGLKGTTKELTAQDKALATQALLMEGAGAAMGDYDRTSRGLANRLRELKARASDFAATVGTALVPIALRALDVFGEVSGGVQAFVSAFKAADGDITSSGFAGFMERLAFLMRQVVDVVRDNLAPVLVGLGTAAAVAFGMWAAAAIPAAVATIAAVAPALALGAALSALAAGVVYAYQHFEGFRTVVQAVADFLTGVVLPAIGAFAGYIVEQFGALVGWVQVHWAAIQEAISHVVAVVQGIVEAFIAVVQAAWQTWGDELVNVATIVWDQIRNVVETVVNLVRGIIEVGLALINGDWGAAWDGIKGILATAWEYIRETVVNGLRLVGQAIEAGLSLVVGLVGELPGRALSALGDLGSYLFTAGQDLIWGFVNGIGSMARRLADAAVNVARGAVNAVKNFLGIGSPSKVFMRLGVNVGEGLAIGMGRSEPGVSAAAKSLGGAAILDAGQGMDSRQGMASRSLASTAAVVNAATTDAKAEAQAIADALAEVLAPILRQAGMTINMAEKADPMHLAREIAWAMG